MAGYGYSISLRLTHPSRFLDEATIELGIIPNRTWEVDTPRTTRRGDALSGVYKENFWTATFAKGASVENDLATVLSAILDRLSPNRDFLRQLTESGGRAEFFIGWFFDGGNSGDVLDHALLGRLADFQIDLSFDVYPDPLAS